MYIHITHITYIIHATCILTYYICTNIKEDFRRESSEEEKTLAIAAKDAGNALYKNGQFEEALTEYTKAIGIYKIPQIYLKFPSK